MYIYPEAWLFPGLTVAIIAIYQMIPHKPISRTRRYAGIAVLALIFLGSFLVSVR